jgi:methionyl-tRNA formyltransferase
MKIAFFGSGEFSKNIFESMFIYEDVNIVLVVSTQDKKVGRKQILEMTPLKRSAQKKEIQILQPEKIRKNEAFFKTLNDLDLDFIIVVAYGKIIPKEILEIPKF